MAIFQLKRLLEYITFFCEPCDNGADIGIIKEVIRLQRRELSFLRDKIKVNSVKNVPQIQFAAAGLMMVIWSHTMHYSLWDGQTNIQRYHDGQLFLFSGINIFIFCLFDLTNGTHIFKIELTALSNNCRPTISSPRYRYIYNHRIYYSGPISSTEDNRNSSGKRTAFHFETFWRLSS